MDLYGLIGYPLGHSFSRKFFNEKFFPENNIDAEYLNFEIPDARMLLDVVRNNPRLKGLNCTIPHKQAIIPYLDELSAQAKRIGAVNVIKIRRMGDAIHLKGYNSDIIGFKDSIRPLLQLHHQKALILGTGGASKAVREGLVDLGIKYLYVSRTPKDGMITYADVTAELLQEYTVIVNCSPVGMFPKVDCCPDIPYEALTPQHLLYDLIYNQEETLFMARGRECGAVTKNGMEMLRLQALASWRFWNED